MECGDTADHVAIGRDNLCDDCRPKAAAAAPEGGGFEHENAE